jgi:hypothetical protein
MRRTEDKIAKQLFEDSLHQSDVHAMVFPGLFSSPSLTDLNPPTFVRRKRVRNKESLLGRHVTSANLC